MLWLILVFIVIPAIEIGIFLWVGGEIGFLSVVLLIILTGIIGIALVRKEGMETWRKAQFAMYNNEPPGEEIVDGICIIASGILMVTPGFFTDLLGFLLVIPFTRKPFKYFIKFYVLKKISQGRFYIGRW